MKSYQGVGLMLLLGLTMTCQAESLTADINIPTTIIGTAEQPTIEGGLINRPSAQKSEKTFAQENTVFTDEFTDNKHLKSLLKEAAKGGKLAYVLAQTEKRHLPASVALIPFVESHYQTHARSPKGAMGAWQLMPSTAKEYGLAIQDRENFIASTQVALHFLDDLHHELGDWTLALAAYHAGLARVKRALRGDPVSRKCAVLPLPLETQCYLQKFNRLYHAMVKYSVSEKAKLM